MARKSVDGLPPWLIEAYDYVGLKERPGPRHEPTIVRWLGELKAWWSDDETPWCGTFVAAMMQECGIPLPRHWYRARAWLNWGVYLPHAVVGAVVVFERGGAGHVGFVVGTDEHERIHTLGGNQGNSVSVAPFDPTRVLGYRWPHGEVVPIDAELPLYADTGPVSRNES